MDFQQFGIDERLFGAAEGLRSRAVFHEKMLTHAVQKKENVCAKITLKEGREEVILLPALQWLTQAGAGAKILVTVPDSVSTEKAAAAARKLGSGLGVAPCIVTLEEPGDGGLPSAVLEGDPSAAVVVGYPAALLAAAGAGLLRLREYGFLVVDGAEHLAELPGETLRKFAGSLLPSWERRTLLACSKISVKAKNLAWDLADNPSEIHIEEEVVKAQSVARETWYLASDTKIRFLLGLIDREKPDRICVFCNLKSTADEVSKRLEVNGFKSDYILGSLPVERKLVILDKVKSGQCFALVLTDEGAQGLSSGGFKLLVNYDIPLEPECFVNRLELLDREAPDAKVVSLACDRYVYGLPAVEQYIDMKLDAVPADESLLKSEDKSAGMVFERSGHFAGAAPGGRLDQRDPPRGDAPPREESKARNGRDRRDGRSQRREASLPSDGPRRDNRSPDIRRSIADATGGSIDMEKVGIQARAPDASARDARSLESKNDRHGRDGRRGPVKPSNRQSGRSSTRHQGPRNDAGREDVRRDGSHQEDPRQGGRRSPEPRGPSRGFVGHTPGSSAGNPYDLPMEERMRRYREKYGRRLENNRSDESRGPVQPSKPRREDTRHEDTRRNNARLQEQEPVTSGRKAPEVAAKPAQPGFLSRLFGGFKKKGE